MDMPTANTAGTVSKLTPGNTPGDQHTIGSNRPCSQTSGDTEKNTPHDCRWLEFLLATNHSCELEQEFTDDREDQTENEPRDELHVELTR